MNDPNRTVMSGAPIADPNRTQIVAPPVAGDPNRTTAFAPSKAVEVAVIASREATMANGPAREQFLIELTSAGITDLPGLGVGTERTPLNLCLVIDRSGSMEGAPLEYVKQACAYVVDMLSPNDVLSIVTFEETVDVLMAPQRVTQKQPIKDGIARLVPGNTTNLYDGMALATSQLLQVNESGRATRMVLLSDGDPTAGIKDFSALVQHAQDIKNRGITVTFLGFGPDYNEELLASMAKRTGGNYYFIPTPNLIPEIFRTELQKLTSVVAQNLRLEVKPARWVSLRSQGWDERAPGANEFTISLADMERGVVMQNVIDLEFSNHPLGWYRVGAARLSYDDCLSGKTETVEIDLVVEFTAEAARYSVAPNPRVRQAADIQAASRAVEKTIMGLKSGQVTMMGAVADLQKTQALLLSEGRTQEAQEVTLALRAIQSGDAGQAEKTLMGTMVQLDQGKRPN